MSYSRFGDRSDVYVFLDVSGTLTCCGCQLEGRRSFDSTVQMVDHLAEHRAAGHRVPDIEDELWTDDAENFPSSLGGDSTGGAT